MVREILDEESAAAKAAKKAGLVHLGFGRYGPKKGGSATHVSKDGKLKAVGDDTGSGDEKSSFFDDPADLSPSQKAHTAAADAELDRIDKDDEPKVPAPDSKSDTGKPRVSANPYDDNYGQEVDDEDDERDYGDTRNAQHFSDEPEDGGDLDSQISQAQKDADDANQMAQQFGGMTQGGDSRYDDAATAANKKLWDLEKQKSQSADDEADDMKSQDAQDSRDAEDRKDAGIKPIKDDKDTQRMGSSVLSRIGGTQDPDRLELQGTQEADNGQTIIQWKDKEDGMMVGVDAQGNIYEDGDRKNYGIQVSTQSDVFGDDQNAQLLYKQKKARETGGIDPYTGKQYPKPARTGKELSRREAKQYIRRNKMKISEDILRKVIREEIKSLMKEDEEAFSQPIPAVIDRYMKKFIDAVSRGNLNRKRKLAILGRVVVALRLDPSEVSKYARLVKKEL